MILSLIVLTAQSASAAQLVRGPYLQMATPASITIRWRTDDFADGRVQYGTNVNNLTLIAENAGSFTNHEVRLTNLFANTTYYYSVGSSSTNLASGAPYSFITSPVEPKPTRIWVIGDSGSANSFAAAVRDSYTNFAGARRTDVWLTLGDNAYFGGNDPQYQAAVFDMFPGLLRQAVIWPSIGNDEIQSAFEDVFTLPRNGEAGGIPSNNETYYAFNYGSIHFVALNSNFDPSTNGVMYRWLAQDLAGNTNLWLIAYWHHPPYSFGSHNSDIDPTQIAMRTNFVQLLEQHGVDLVLCGHSHDYERSYLLHGHYGFSTNLEASMILDHGSGRTNQGGAYVKLLYGPDANKGAVYVVAGASSRPLFVGAHPAMYYSSIELGSLVIDVNGYRLDARYLDDNGSLSDYFTLIKKVLPTLRIALTGTDVVLTWPADATNFSAEVTSALDASIQWLEVTNTATLSGSEWKLRLPRTNTHQFFRVAEQ